MIFSSELLNKQESKNKTSEKKLNMNTNFFFEALDGILYEDALFESVIDSVNEGIVSFLATKAAYKYIEKKSTDNNSDNKTDFDSIINSVKNFDFSLSNIITKLVEGFVKLIVRLFREFEVICMNFVSKNDQILRFKNKISLLGEQIKYSEPYFNYTNIRNSTTYANIETSFRQDFNILTQTLYKIDHLTESEIEQELNKLQYESVYDEYDELRGRLLGTNTLIKEEDFATELFKYFRNNMSEPFKFGYIDPNDLHKRLDAWLIASKTIKLCQKDKDNMEKAGRKLVSDFKSIKLSKYNTGSVNRISFIRNIINNYIHKTKNICNIYVLYFSSKLDATKEELISNRAILFEACKFIVREGL